MNTKKLNNSFVKYDMFLNDIVRGMCGSPIIQHPVHKRMLSVRLASIIPQKCAPAQKSGMGIV